MIRKIGCILLAVLLVVSALPALAATPTDGSSSYYYNVIDFKFFHYQNGIGYGNCPVYTAPSASAYRTANGKASIDTNHDMWVGGFETGSGWLMVRYETNNGGVRVGYIPPEYIRGFKPNLDKLKFSYIEQTAAGYIKITDNPLNSNTSFAVLAPGETYHILAQYTYYGNWWYIECYVNGQVARGFIDRSSVTSNNGNSANTTANTNYNTTVNTTNNTTNVGEPDYGPQGQSKIGRVRVQGDRKFVRKNAGEGYDRVATVSYPDDFPCYDRKTGTNGRWWYLIWVDSHSTWGWISEGVSTFY
ncbi:MAG: hypothetical protein IJQ33_05500 [Clostridia bacterium]|nr:hypothetical protein [Clostridia bacterium]